MACVADGGIFDAEDRLAERPIRPGTDNLPILSQPMQTMRPGAADTYAGLNTPSVWRHARSQAAAKVEARSSNGMDEIEIAAFLRKQAD